MAQSTVPLDPDEVGQGGDSGVASAPASSGGGAVLKQPDEVGQSGVGVAPPPQEPSTPLGQPLPSIFDRPEGQGIGGYLKDLWAHETQGATQTAADAARVAADTWSIGQGDRGVAAATGSTTAAERAQTDAAHARLTAISPVIDYASQGLGYMVPGPADLFGAVNLSMKGYEAALPLVKQALPTASKAAQDAVARIAAYSAHSGLTAAVQDVGHDVTSIPQIIGDSAIGATIGGAVHGTNEAVAAGASKAKDWVKSILPGAPSTPLPKGTPAEVSAATPQAPPGQPMAPAHKLEELQNNMAITGKPPTPDEIENYGNRQFGTDKSKWPADWQNIYNAVKPRPGLNWPARAGISAVTGAGQWALGHLHADPITYGVQVGAQGLGELGAKLYQGDPIARAGSAIKGSYPALTGWESTGTSTSPTWTDAIHKGIALPLAQPQ